MVKDKKVRNAILIIFLLLCGFLIFSNNTKAYISLDKLYEYEINTDGENTVTLIKSNATLDAIPEIITGENSVEYIVTRIGNDALKENENLINPTIPETIIDIGDNAFENCTNLKNIILPEGLISIGVSAFLGCNNITEIIIPGKTNIIKSSAFMNCSKLQNIYIPDNVETIEDNLVFEGCNNIKVYCKSNSVAHTYAIENTISYELDDIVPVLNIEIETQVEILDETTIKETFINIKSNEKLQTLDGWTLSEDMLCLTKEYIKEKHEDIVKNVEVKDLVGNITTALLKELDFVAIVNYSTTEPTNQNVIVTIIHNSYIQEIAGWTSEYASSLSKEFSENTTEDVIFMDFFENEINVQVVVDNIDKEEPILEENYSTTEPTNQSVIVTITSNEPIQETAGWTLSEDQLSITQEYTENFTEYVIVNDLAGNEVLTVIEIDNIDKVAPTLETTYSTTEPTNQNVMVTITSNEPMQLLEEWVLSEDKLSMTKEYTENVKEDVIVKDLAGNEVTVTVQIENIDKTIPILEISYDMTESTIHAIVTITSNEPIQQTAGWTLLEDKLSMEKEYTENITEDVIVKDLVGNEATATVKVTDIDKEAPILEISYSEENLTKEDVAVTITSNEPMQLLEEWVLSEDKLSMEKVYIENTTEDVTVKDLAGNESTVTVQIENIDKEVPILEISYSEEEPTTQNVIVTIESDEAIQETEGWTLSEDTLSMTKEYTENTIEEVTVKDIVGNEDTITVEVFNIDRIAPIVEVTYTEEELTNQNVIVTIEADELIQETEGWTLSEDKLNMEKEYTENTTEDVIVKDIAGNESTVTVQIENIDKEAPILEISYSEEELTKEDVVVTITSNEPMQLLEEWVLSEDELSMEKVYIENTTEDVTVKDIAGNESTVTVQIENIDKEAPILEISYSEEEPTNQNVIVTIESDESIQETEGWTLSEDTLSMTKEYTENTIEEVTVKDIVGNEDTITVEVFNIDRIAPIVEATYSEEEPTNQNVIVTITANELIQQTEGWILSEDELSMEKVYIENATEEVIVKDIAGNESTVTVQIANIDRIAPIVEATYSEEELTNQNVVVTITSNKPMQLLEGWTLSEDGLSMTKEYTENTTEDVIVKDIAGNESTVIVQITNIDKTIPIVEISYSTQEITNKNIIVTITSNKKIQRIEGWNIAANELSATKEYTQNTSESVIIKDLLGNATNVGIRIENIDKTAPTITGIENGKKYTEIVKPSITDTNLEIVVLEKDGNEVEYNNGDTIVNNGKYTLTAEDKAGNVTTIQFELETTSQASISSTVYNINYEKQTIKKISPRTLQQDFRRLINTISNYEIIKADGTNLEEDKPVGTGMKLRLENNIEYTLIINGDINRDGDTSIIDLISVKRHVVGMTILTGINEEAGDCTGDGVITITDILQIKRFIIGLAEL